MKIHSKLRVTHLILVVTIVFLLSLIGLPRPSFEQATNRKPEILPSEAEVLEYNKDGKWVIELDPKLAQTENLVVKAIDTKSLKNFSELKGIKSPIKFTRNKGKIVVSLQENMQKDLRDVIVAIGKSQTNKKVSWKKSYLVNLKPKLVFNDSDTENKQTNSKKTKTDSKRFVSKEFRGEQIITSEKFIFGKPKPSPEDSPSDEECSVSPSLFNDADAFIEGERNVIIVDYFPQNAKLLSATISDVKAVASKPVNISKSTSMSFKRKDFDNFTTFYTDDAKWYGVSENPPTDYLCFEQDEQSKYKALIKVKMRKSNGEVCGAEEEFEFIVSGESEWVQMTPSMHEVYDHAIRIAESNTRRCCAEVYKPSAPIIVKTYVIGGTEYFTGQYRNIMLQEEKTHARQWMGQLPWSKGGVLNEPSNERVLSHFDRIFKKKKEPRKFCSYAGIFSKNRVNMCAKAKIYAKRGLKKATYATKKEFASWYNKKINVCYREKTAKDIINFDYTKASHHYECAYRDTCPAKISTPPFIPKPVPVATLSLNEEGVNE